jgi:hypothetical protein
VAHYVAHTSVGVVDHITENHKRVLLTLNYILNKPKDSPKKRLNRKEIRSSFL